MKTIIMVLISVLSLMLLSSCGSRTNANLVGNPASTNTPTGSDKDQKVDPVLCTGPAVSSITGRWTLTQTSGATTRDLSLMIQDSTTTLSTSCTKGNLSRSATASVTSSFDASHLTFLSKDDKITGDRQLTCESNLSQGVTTYTIKGRCLSININGPHIFRYLGN